MTGLRLNSRIICALAVVGLIAFSFVVIGTGLIKIPASYAVSPQTYYLDPTSGAGSCTGDLSLDGSAPASTGSVSLNPQDTATFCDSSVPATIYTFDITLVLYIASGVTGLQFAAYVNDLTTSTSQPFGSVSTSTLSSSTCSSPTKLTLDLTVGASATYSVGDAIALTVEDYIASGSFTICTGGSYASYMTINPLAVTTLTSVSTTTLTTTSTTTATSTILVYPTTTHITCNPNVTKIGRSVYCTAIVKSPTSLPTGTISFGWSEGKIGAAAPPVACIQILSTNSCYAHITFSFPKTGYPVVTAAYSGDLMHQTSHGATVVHVVLYFHR
jgi:hypothetical protein